mmetsp:Transcript_29007/g.81146  ORF Transcript_29007/g.81146 Transcript_29007/m.81146 type:complete len:177 (-) Transcript_29007:80-610(-)|eukprot:CAMPEP_0119131362 /NCGR_PEP_ID=MMETSP1310-20130426/10142_1 /TAXON_ID=464262 /ORGANISM="Genus nov. species nov., Strain RCC2339" /LENGTH=176 /DNA_ID=CAMNT_0007121929 /DNA_START=113 /DNA_END=643 /DNA_ORIENTATION=-
MALPTFSMMLAARSATSRASMRWYSALPTGAMVKDTTGADVPVGERFAGKNVVVVGVPGAFTPLCTSQHVPGFISRFSDLQAKGMDELVVLSVNDHFVMKAWKESLGAPDAVQFVADPDGSFVTSLGVDMDIPPLGGKRAKRFCMIVKDNEIVHQAVEDTPGDLGVSSADEILNKL